MCHCLLLTQTVIKTIINYLFCCKIIILKIQQILVDYLFIFFLNFMIYLFFIGIRSELYHFIVFKNNNWVILNNIKISEKFIYDTYELIIVSLEEVFKK